jgi:hypothetical protein
MAKSGSDRLCNLAVVLLTNLILVARVNAERRIDALTSSRCVHNLEGNRENTIA